MKGYGFPTILTALYRARTAQKHTIPELPQQLHTTRLQSILSSLTPKKTNLPRGKVSTDEVRRRIIPMGNISLLDCTPVYVKSVCGVIDLPAASMKLRHVQIT